MAIKHPVFARLYPAMSRAMDHGGMTERRRHLLAGLTGDVLEIGAGNGLNFPHYVASIERAGLTIERLDHYLFPEARTPLSFHVLGSARRSPSAD